MQRNTTTTPPIKPKKILVIDLDNCTIAPQRSKDSTTATEHLLVENQIEYAKNGGFDGFYVCTHRSYHTDYFNIQTHAEAVEAYRDNLAWAISTQPTTTDTTDAVDFSHSNQDDHFVINIVKNFMQATGFEEKQCLAISTPDDKGQKCGDGYTKWLKPAEEAALKTKSVKPFIRDGILGSKTRYYFDLDADLGVQDYDTNSKNEQLIQVAEHASNSFRGQAIELHYLDDSKKVLGNALKIPAEQLPQNVTLFINEHDGYESHQKPMEDAIVRLGAVKGAKPLLSLTTLGLFNKINNAKYTGLAILGAGIAGYAIFSKLRK